MRDERRVRLQLVKIRFYEHGMELMHSSAQLCISNFPIQSSIDNPKSWALASHTDLIENVLRFRSKRQCKHGFDWRLVDQKMERKKTRVGLSSFLISCNATVNTALMSPVTENVSVNKEKDVLGALATIMDPDFGMDIVSCGFVKDMKIQETAGQVSFRLELTTPACPVKDMFENQARERVTTLPWVKEVAITMSSQPAKPIVADDMPRGLQSVSNIIAVSSCKGGVGKSTVAVNLAYSLAGMGARVGIFDADVYGPSLPTMVSPELRVLQMDAETRSIIPTEYLGVKLVSFGFAGQGNAVMRGPMVSGVINQLLTTTEW